MGGGTVYFLFLEIDYNFSLLQIEGGTFIFSVTQLPYNLFFQIIAIEVS